MGSRNPKSKTAERRARLAEMRRAAKARDRRNKIITIVVCAVIVVGLIGGGWYLIAKAQADKEAQAAPLKGEKTWSKLSQTHVTKQVTYPMSPGAGGNHSATWANCDGDVYTEEVPDMNAVHSLEHGAVWVTYTSKASAGEVKTLGARVAETPYSLMSPRADQSAPIVLTAWGHQLTLDKASDSRLAEFFDKYVQGDQTPEPGAACTGGSISAGS